MFSNQGETVLEKLFYKLQKMFCFALGEEEGRCHKKTSTHERTITVKQGHVVLEVEPQLPQIFEIDPHGRRFSRRRTDFAPHVRPL